MKFLNIFILQWFGYRIRRICEKRTVRIFSIPGYVMEDYEIYQWYSLENIKTGERQLITEPKLIEEGFVKIPNS